jgi:hypothetical protein
MGHIVKSVRIIEKSAVAKNQLVEELATKERFYLLIEEERVGPFVRIGKSEHLTEILGERGIVTETYRRDSESD